MPAVLPLCVRQRIGQCTGALQKNTDGTASIGP